MKKILLVFSLLALVCIAPATAKGHPKKKKHSSKEIVIQTKSDSLSYAYGANLVQEDLLKYLKSLHILENKDKSQQLVDGIRESLEADSLLSPYYMGAGIGDQMKKMSDNFAKSYYGDEKNSLDFNIVAKGVTDALTGQALVIDSVKNIIEDAYKEVSARYEKEQERKNASSIEKADKFLEENKSKEGIVTLINGIQYKILIEGKGEKPKATDKVKVNYRGTLADGTEFDSSYKRGEPITFNLNQVIPGWTEVIQLMPVGSKWQVFIPYILGYGGREVGNIPPYSTLIFEIELLGIEK